MTTASRPHRTRLPVRLLAATSIAAAATFLVAVPATAAPPSSGTSGRPAGSDDGRGTTWHGNSRVDNGHHADNGGRSHGHDRTDAGRHDPSDDGGHCLPRGCTGPR
ncbi:hypothetical protein [Nocardia salmonicida]|uniref:hypothetical protein n=1 Tax=Nocardia salmonicida TaxID=53431 RepID=UPI0012F4D9C7|nr:hypothetical protein [Nocardia salmonicida]